MLHHFSVRSFGYDWKANDGPLRPEEQREDEKPADKRAIWTEEDETPRCLGRSQTVCCPGVKERDSINKQEIVRGANTERMTSKRQNRPVDCQHLAIEAHGTFRHQRPAKWLNGHDICC